MIAVIVILIALAVAFIAASIFEAKDHWPKKGPPK